MGIESSGRTGRCVGRSQMRNTRIVNVKTREATRHRGELPSF